MVGTRKVLVVRDSLLLSHFLTYLDILYIKLKLGIRAISDINNMTVWKTIQDENRDGS